MKSSEPKLNVIDRVIGFFSPRSLAEREYWRSVTQAVKSNAFFGAEGDRLGSDLLGVPDGTAESIYQADRATLRQRARSLEINSDIASGAVESIVVNCIGTGIDPDPTPVDAHGSPLDELADIIKEEWAKFVEEADITGQSSFHELQQIAFRRWIYDGEIFINLVRDRRRGDYLKLQPIEAEFVDYSGYTSGKTPQGTTILSGVEVDDYLRPVAYHYVEPDALGGFQFNAKRIPAKNIVHLYKRHRTTQVRGYSKLAPTIKRISDVERYLEAKILGAKIAASFAIFVKSPTGGLGRTSKLQADPNDPSRKLSDVSPGMIHYLKDGEEITTASPTNVDSDTKSFIEQFYRLIGNGMGISYELASRDLSLVNYSSARQGHLEDIAAFEVLQAFFDWKFNGPIYRAFVESLYLSGKLPINDFYQNYRNYVKTAWLHGGWDWIDPDSETKAAKEGLLSGLTTHKRVLAAQGIDWEETFTQLAREKEMAEELGLNLDVFTPEFKANEGKEGDEESAEEE